MTGFLIFWLFNFLVGLFSVLLLGNQYDRMRQAIKGESFFEDESGLIILEYIELKLNCSRQLARFFLMAIYGMSLGLVPLAPLLFLIAHSLQIYIYKK